MNKWMILFIGMSMLAGCEAAQEHRLEGYWVNRNTESHYYDRKVVFFAPFEEIPENAENYAGIYRIGYLAGDTVAKDSVTEGWWRISYAPSEQAGRNVFALIMAPQGDPGSEQRFEFTFDGDRLILADFQNPEITVERYSRVGTVLGL